MTPILFLDLDKTLWDHFDASILQRPFKLYSRDCIVDGRGEKLCLYDGVREFLKFCKKNNFIIASLSWNRYCLVRDIMDLLDITKYFDYLFNKFYPLKNEILVLAMKIIKKDLALKNYPKAIYIDDQRRYYEQVKNVFNKIYFIHMWVDINSYRELMNYIRSLTNYF